MMNNIRDKKVSDIFPARVSNCLHRGGIITVGQFQDCIINYGLKTFGDGSFYFGDDGPILRNAGKKTWEIYIKFLDDINFDWEKYILPKNFYQPKSQIEYEIEINHKIKELIKLMTNYGKMRGKP